MQIGINVMSTIGAMREDFEGTAVKLKEAGCSYFEAMSDWGAKPETVAFYASLTGKSGWDPENTLKRLDFLHSIGMDIKGMFVFEDCLEEQAEALGEYCKAAGITYVVLSFLDYGDIENVYQKIQMIKNVSAVLKHYGVQIIQHNHEHDYLLMKDRDGVEKPVIDIILGQCSPKELMLEIDTGWLVYAGIEAKSYIKENIDRIAILQFKDICKNYKEVDRQDIFLACGEGAVDFKGILDGIPKEKRDTLLYILDQDNSKNDIVEDHIKSIRYFQELEKLL